MDSPAPSIDRAEAGHPLIIFLSSSFWVVLWFLSWVKALVAFATISVPRFIYAILSYSMTLTLNFWSFAVMFTLSLVALNYFIRFRYLNKYTELNEVPLVKADAKELHPDVNPPEAAPAFHNYLDEFLQAVRVFGFLEKPVFHELARHLQTRRLIAGDSLSLDQDKSFYCVVDGTVQLFARTDKPASHARSGTWDEEDMNGYQLLNEVGTGGTLSSLFTILSLFTENVKISWQDSEDAHDTDADTESDLASVAASEQSGRPPTRPRAQRSNSDVSTMHLDFTQSPMPISPRSRSRGASVSSSGSTIHQADVASPIYGSTPHAPSLSGISNSSTGTYRRRPAPDNNTHSYGVVARATEDSTLAVIPAEAFRRLTKKFPKAAAHIVQVILTRFSRVTFNAAHNYLGLTTEVLRTEKAINDIACHPLPPSFYEGGGLRHLRQRFDAVSTSDSDTDRDSDYFSYPGSSVPSRNSSTHNLPFPKLDLKQGSKGKQDGQTAAEKTVPITPFKGAAARQQIQAGDLHTSAMHSNEAIRPQNRSRSSLYTPMPPPGSPHRNIHGMQRLNTVDFDLRDEVMSCIAKSIGLLQPPLSGEESVEASPAFPPSESGRSPRSSQMLGSSFGSLTLLGMGDDASSERTASSTGTGDGYMSGLDNEVEILFFPAGSVLAKAGEMNTGLFYVIEGFLDILLPQPSAPTSPNPQSKPATSSISTPYAGAENIAYERHAPPEPREKVPKPPKPLFTVRPGGIAGYLSSLCNTASYVDIIAKTDTYVGFLPSHALERLLEKRPIVLLTLAKRLISLLSPLVLHIDGSLDWVQVNAGQVLWRPDDVSDSFYIVINGRLRALAEKETGGVSIVAEYGQGDTVGELDVITSSPRRTTVHAIRDTELIRMPQTLFNAISSRNPGTTAQLLRMIASRVRSEVDSSTRLRPTESPRSSNINLKTVAVLPSSRNVPVEAFGRKLFAALESIGAPTSYLNQSSVSDHLGRHAFTRMGKLKAAGWLAEQEQKYRIVLYVADSAVTSSWTQTCIRQADYVMVVGMGEDPSLGEYERLLLSMKTTARKELVLLHPDRMVVPGSTRAWLKNRPWIHQHLHVELPGIIVSVPRAPTAPQDPAALTAFKNLKDKVQSGIQRYRGGASDARPQRGPHTNDFARLARRICGKSIGVVLGGGGARGISHLGLLRALEEYGIPVDHIGGTSIGAFVGGLYAREGDIISSAGRAKQFSGRMGNIWRMLSDVTYPIVAYTTGHEFNRAIWKSFSDVHIEDMWLPYFCNSTNINTSKMEIHETGYAWRYIRASMTLVGLLPPLSDNGQMLVDGGYLDNLPVATMMSMGASAVIASDVGSIDDNSPRRYGDSVSGWWLLINRWNPFSNAKNIPAITEIQSRLAYVSSVRTLEEAKISHGCLYMQMPVQEYGTLQFSKFDEIQKKGYEAAMDILQKWDADGSLPSAYIGDKQSGPSAKRKGRSARRNSI
ncbi:patatin-domain-containing protein [Trametopsis cervina]|nr:patatin-domain-containing protein [Trametopsis cervina]